LAVAASDTMRSIGIAVPWVMFGLLRFKGEFDLAGALRLIVVLQILAPAAQVTGPKVEWVSCLPIELYRLAHVSDAKTN